MKDYTEFPLEINAERLMQLPAGITAHAEKGAKVTWTEFISKKAAYRKL